MHVVTRKGYEKYNSQLQYSLCGYLGVGVYAGARYWRWVRRGWLVCCLCDGAEWWVEGDKHVYVFKQ